MRAKLALWAAMPLLLGVTGCEFDEIGAGRVSKDFHFNYPLKAGAKVSVETFNGSVELSGWDQDTVDIAGTKYGPSEDAAEHLRVDVSHTAASVDIRVIRPSESRGNRGARFTIRMPRKALVDHILTSNGSVDIRDAAGPSRVRTSNGAIRIDSLDGSLDAHTSNGAVELTRISGEAVIQTSNGRIRAEHIQGALDASTSNGGIVAILGPGASARSVRLDTSNSGVEVTVPEGFASGLRVNTSNGGITVHLPEQMNASVRAHTNNSSINSDFPVRVQGEMNKNNLDGVIGSGGTLIDLNTSNASIRLLKL